MKLELKAKDKKSKMDSMFEKVYRSESDTGLMKPIYRIKNAPETEKYLKIIKRKRVSLLQAIQIMYPEKDSYDCEVLRKNLEKVLKHVLQIFGIEAYKDDLKMSSARTAKYQFSEDDFPFLKSLSERCNDYKEDLLWDGIGLYGCFCRAENIDGQRLADIGKIISTKIGIHDLDYIVPLEWQLQDIKEYSYNIMRSEEMSPEDKIYKYEAMIDGLDALLKQWTEMA